MSNLLEGYNRFLEIKECTKQTFKTYNFNLEMFFKFLEKEITLENVLLLEKKDFENYLINLDKQGLSSNTKQIKFASILSFLNYLDEDYNGITEIFKNCKVISRKIKEDKDKRQEKLTLKEGELLLDVISQEKNKNRDRNLLMFTIFLNLGLRLSEVRNLKHSDFNIRKNELRVFGKGEKVRYLPLKSTNILSLYYTYIGTNVGLDQDEFVFLSTRKTQISERQIQKELAKYLEKCDIDKNIHIHSLRRTFATMLYNEGKVELYTLQKLMGHSSSNTTKIYTEVSTERLSNALENHPLFKENN